MDKEEFIATMSAYDFSVPVNVTVSFEDSDEEESRPQSIKKEVESDTEETTTRSDVIYNKEPMIEPGVRPEKTVKMEPKVDIIKIEKPEVNEEIVSAEKLVIDSHKNVTENLGIYELLSLKEKYYSKNRVENHKPDSPKKRKLDDTLKVQAEQKELIRNSRNSDMTVLRLKNNESYQNGQGTGGTAEIHANPHNIENLPKICENTSENTIMDSCITNLLKTVSKHLIFIVKAYSSYSRTVNDKRVSEKLIAISTNRFLRIKYHFFHLSYCTVLTILLPQENNSGFITKFVHDTVQLANDNSVTYQPIFSYFMELLDWTKRKQDSLSNLPIHFDTSNSEQNADKSELRQNSTQPMQLGQTYSGVVDNKNTNGINNCEQNEKYALLKQSLNQPPQQFYSKVDSNKNNISGLSANLSSTVPFVPPVSNNSSNENVTQEQNTCIFTSGQPGRQISINVNPLLLNQENRQAFTCSNSQVIAHNQPRDCNVHQYQHAQPPWAARNVEPTNYQHQLQFDQRRLPSSQPAGMNHQNRYNPQNFSMPGYHGRPRSQQPHPLPSSSVAGPLPSSLMARPLPPTSAAQPLQPTSAAQPHLSTSLARPLSTSAAQPLPSSLMARSVPPTSAAQPLLPASLARPLPPTSAAQPLQPSSAAQPHLSTLLARPPLPMSAAQPLQPAPPAYHMAYNWLNQAPITMSQYSMNNQPMQPPQYEATDQQNQPETNRSVSTDSGFTSPLHFNSPIEQTNDTWAQEQQNIQPTPLITHVTSLNPKASYMDDSPCSVCTKTTRLKCIGCMSIYYCSYECQQTDWNSHKIICWQKS